jgi:hypothetical protein
MRRVSACFAAVPVAALVIPSLELHVDGRLASIGSVFSNWSTTANWQCEVAPSGTVGTLTFPAPPDPPCHLEGAASYSASGTCCQTQNDLSALDIKLDGSSICFASDDSEIGPIEVIGEKIALSRTLSGSAGARSRSTEPTVIQ